MELSCAFPFRPDLPEIAREAEALGYERMWVYDSPALFGDIWMALALCATSTSRIGLGTGVLVPSLRHPMVNAAAVASLEQLAPGRVVVGVGTGFTGRYVLGQPPMTWKATETYLEQFIGLLRGETVEVDGAPVRMMHPDGFVAPRPLSSPILVGANGPKGLAVAERVGADGVVSIFGAQPGWDRCTLLMYGTVLDEGESLESERVMDAAGAGAAVMFHGMYEADPSLLDAVEGGPQWRAAVEAFPERERHLHTHEQHFVAMTDRDRASVTGELIAATTWTATADAVRARAKETADSGVSELMYVPMGSDVIRELRAVRAAID